jgi:uncharacterized damage-inducible protein DinB
MERIPRLRRLFAYDTWANREALTSVTGLSPGAAAPGLRLVAHIGAAHHLWLARVRGDAPPLPVWPELDAAETGRVIESAGAAWQRLLAERGAAELDRSVTYTNSKGERWTSTVDDIIEHALLHAHYHRGQAAAEVRAAGGTPAYTDFIHAVRTNVLPSEETVHG